MKVALRYFKLFIIIIFYHLFVYMQTAGVHTARALGESKPLFVRSNWTTALYRFFEKRSKLSVECSIIIILKVYNTQTSEFNLMSDKINHSTQMSSKNLQ